MDVPLAQRSVEYRAWSAFRRATMPTAGLARHRAAAGDAVPIDGSDPRSTRLLSIDTAKSSVRNSRGRGDIAIRGENRFKNRFRWDF
jgi:hypothetical protein